MLSGEQAHIYEKGLDGILLTDEETTTYYDIIEMLRAIAKTQSQTYVGDENSPHNKSFEYEKNNIICKTILNKS